jgi:hypothetical protein
MTHEENTRASGKIGFVLQNFIVFTFSSTLPVFNVGYALIEKYL